MSIDLHYILRRNKSNLKIFIQKNRLTTYAKLLEYCDSRKFIPCTEEAYNQIVKEEVKQNGRKEVSGEISKAQLPKKRRYRRKKQQDTSELSDSTDKG